MGTLEKRETLNYYNDNDQFSVRWIRALIDAGLIPKGEVDDRSITDIRPSDLEGFTQCHFFAGIGGWSYALQLADWPDDRPVWTGSCPCQPFSNAGKQEGLKDPRHLWPAWRWLIAQCRPTTIFGEQVASKLAREQWLPGVQTDLETMGYSTAAADLCSAGVYSPNIRQRIWWVGNTGGEKPRRVSSIRGEEMASPWTSSQAIMCRCRDGKHRRIPVESALSPLAPRLPKRVGLLRGAGNSINPYIAAEFIKAAINY